MFRQYRPLEINEEIVVGADTSAGIKDYCAAQFLSKTKLDVPLVYHSKKIATEMTNDLLPVLNKINDITGITPTIAYERQAGGMFELDRLSSLNKQGKFVIFKMPTYGQTNNETTPKLGWDTNSATRPAMLSALKDAVDNKLIRIYDKPTINELFSFVITTTSSSFKAQAEKNAHDDLIMALAIAWQLYQLAPTQKQQKVYIPPFELAGGIGMSEGQWL